MGWEDITLPNRGPPFKNPAQERAVRRKKQDQKAASKVGEAIVKLLRERNTTMAKKASKSGKGSKKTAKGATQEDLFEDVKMGAEDEDGFAQVYDPESGETWQYEEEGDAIDGIFFDSFVNKGGEYGDSNCWKVFDPESETIHLAWGTFVLDKYMEKIKPGTYVRIEYRGKAGRAHNFRVQVHPGNTKKYAKVAADLIAKAAEKKEKKDDGIPF